ncbi:MAG: hypothetical protein R2709_14570 [Marmoricola sp.]
MPADWPILIDTSVADTDWLVIGSGIRGSKLAARAQTWPDCLALKCLIWLLRWPATDPNRSWSGHCRQPNGSSVSGSSGTSP